MIGILPRSGWKLHKKPRDGHISRACSALPGTSDMGKEHRSQRLNFISQLTQKLQACFVFMRNLHQMTVGEHPACSCAGDMPLCARSPHAAGSPTRCVPQGSMGAPQDTDPTFIGSNPGSLTAHTTQTSEENQSTFGDSEYLALVMKNG